MESKDSIESFLDMRNHELKSKRNSILRKTKDVKIKNEINELHDAYNASLAFVLSQLKLRIIKYKE